MTEQEDEGRRAAGDSAPGPLLAEPTRVDIASIEQELTRLWKSPGQAGEGAVTRACALNLVVHVEGDGAAAAASETIAHVASHDPNRAIVVIADPQAASGFDAWISTHCFLPAPGSPQVCCEQITLTAGGDATARAPGLVLPLLVADLPVVLWWIGDPPLGSESFESFADAANQVILDSADFADPASRLPLLAKWIQVQGSRPAVSDLNWARLTPWRELVAQFFDGPEMLPYLSEIVAIRVEYAAGADGGASPAQAVLLVGWLGSRLGWSLAEWSDVSLRSAKSWYVAADGGSIEVELASALRPSASPGTVTGVAIRTRGRQAATFSILREAESDCVETRCEVEGRQPISRTICPPAMSVHYLLCQELELVGRDRVFEESLALVATSQAPRRQRHSP